MIAFGAPWALVAGVGLAAAALLLHLFAPRPPARAPLPTARFLRPDARTFVRPRRLPSDLPVLALRALLALLLGALFAQPRWMPDREEATTRVVLLDRGAGMAEGWPEAHARALAEAAGAERALVVPFDTAVGAARRGDEASAGAGGAPGTGPAGEVGDGAGAPADVESSYLVALRALRRTALNDARTTDIEAVLVTRPRWAAWDSQLAALRGTAWPGRIRVIDPTAPSEAASVAPPLDAAERGAPFEAPSAAAPAARRLAALPEAGSRHRTTGAALAALGYEVADAAVASEATTLRFVDAADPTLFATLDRAARGDTVVVFGASAVGGGDPPALDRGDGRGAAAAAFAGLWDVGGWPPPDSPPRLLRLGGVTLALDTDIARAPGAATGSPGRRLPIAWEDGAPAAAARAVASGCIVRFGSTIDAGAGDPAYPRLLRALADGCREPGRSTGLDAPLDDSAADLLVGEGAPTVAVASLDAAAGRALEPWVLLALLLVALAETGLVEALRRRGVDGR